MSDYHDIKEKLENLACKSCGGIGTVDDAEPGDISFNTYQCQPCEGSGFKDAVRLKLIRQD